MANVLQHQQVSSASPRKQERNRPVQFVGLDQVLTQETKIRDLRVLIDAKLTLKEHIAAQVAKANRTLGIIRRTFTYMDKNTLVLLFKSLVRPHLDYCNIVIYPRTIGLMQDVERVQRRATKQLSHLRDLPYEERLQYLDLPSMTYRLRRGDAIELYKYTHLYYNVANISYSVTSTRGHPLKLKKPRCNTTLRMKTFPYRAIEDWNSLRHSSVINPQHLQGSTGSGPK